MKRTIVFVSVLLCLGWAAWVSAAQNYPATQQELENEIANMPWESDVRAYELTASHSQLNLPAGYAMVRGEAARRFMFLGQGNEAPETEAVLINPDTGTQLIFSYHETGYITLDDWGNLDTDALLQQMIEITQKENTERMKHNLPQLNITGWLQEPTLNRGNNSVNWTLDLNESGGRTINAIAIKLGRSGFTKLTWVGTYQDYAATKNLMPSFLQAHRFDSGFRYADYSMGDRLAGFGIASLVAITAGGNPKTKAGLAALFAAIVAFGKKFFVIPVVVALGALGTCFKKLFSGKDADPGGTSGN